MYSIVISFINFPTFHFKMFLFVGVNFCQSDMQISFYCLNICSLIVFICKHSYLLQLLVEIYQIDVCMLFSCPCHVSPQLIEAVVLPMTHRERFEALGVQPPKGEATGVLIHS